MYTCILHTFYICKRIHAWKVYMQTQTHTRILIPAPHTNSQHVALLVELLRKTRSNSLSHGLVEVCRVIDGAIFLGHKHFCDEVLVFTLGVHLHEFEAKAHASLREWTIREDYVRVLCDPVYVCMRMYEHVYLCEGALVYGRGYL